MKLLESNYYPDGFSNVILEHQGKQYEGKSFYSKEEKYPPSPFFGQRLAENRAMIKYWKERRDINRIKEQALKSLLKDLEPHIQDGVEEIILKKLKQHIKYYNKEIKDCEQQINYLKCEIKESLKIRKQLLDKVKKT